MVALESYGANLGILCSFQDVKLVHGDMLMADVGEARLELRDIVCAQCFMESSSRQRISSSPRCALAPSSWMLGVNWSPQKAR